MTDEIFLFKQNTVAAQHQGVNIRTIKSLKSKDEHKDNRDLRADKRDSIATIDPYHTVADEHIENLIWNVRSNQSRDSGKWKQLTRLVSCFPHRGSWAQSQA